jgi:mannose-1-phosphate guanylyltransferase
VSLRPDMRNPSRASFDHVFALILAGGSGTRFWPLSRRKQPKQLLRLFGKQSLLQQAAARIRTLVPPERIYVFTSEAIRAAVQKELPEVPRAQVVAEPASRNTAPAIGLAAYEMARRDPESIMLVLPSDHIVAKPGAFRQTLICACRVAAEPGRSVVIGIKPTRPETGFGYIRLGSPQDERKGVFKVDGFTEKPATHLAQRYVRSGKFLWNGGMFIWRTATLIANLERYQPSMSTALHRISREGGIGSPRVLARLYPRLENISIDYALMEKVQDIFAVSADIGWSDVGSWAAAYELSRKDDCGNVVPGAGFLLDSEGNMIVSEKKFIATVGARDLVIVETDDALLVCAREKSQDVGKIVRELQRRKLTELL